MPRIIATGFPRSDLRTNPTTFASSFFGLSTSRLAFPSTFLSSSLSLSLSLCLSIYIYIYIYLPTFLRVYRRVRILSQTLFAVLENFSIGFTLAKLSRYAKDTSVPCCSGHSEKRLPGVCARISQSVCFPAGRAKEGNVDRSEDPFSRYSR